MLIAAAVASDVVAVCVTVLVVAVTVVAVSDATIFMLPVPDDAAVLENTLTKKKQNKNLVETMILF